LTNKKKQIFIYDKCAKNAKNGTKVGGITPHSFDATLGEN